MAVLLIFTVAADREVSLVGQPGEQFNGMSILGRSHLGAVLLDKRCPLSRCFGFLPLLHCFDARGQVGKPHVIPILRGELSLWHPPGWTANSSDTYALICCSCTSQPDNSNSHHSSPM